VECWDLSTIEATGKREPRVLFSHGWSRAILIDLLEGEEMGEHRVHEHAVVHVVSGAVAVAVDDHATECAAGCVITFDATETRSIRALAPSRLLLVLAPWPGDGHFLESEHVDPEHMPASVAVPPSGLEP
jgi:quercetin dioxygenase-like cupin family protein